MCDCVCVCVFSSHPFWTSSSLDVPAGVTQEEGHTGFLIHLPSAVRALIFVARRIQPFLSLVDREVEFLCTPHCPSWGWGWSQVPHRSAPVHCLRSRHHRRWSCRQTPCWVVWCVACVARKTTLNSTLNSTLLALGDRAVRVGVDAEWTRLVV